MAAPKRIAIDFDGTLCEFAFPQIGPIKHGAKEAVDIFRALGFKIIIWSCRTCHWDYDVYGGDDPSEPTLERERVKDMIAWLDKHGIAYDEIDDGSKGKPGADYYIDDKGLRFTDNWNDIASFILRIEMDKNAAAREPKKEGKLILFRKPAEPDVQAQSPASDDEGPFVA